MSEALVALRDYEAVGEAVMLQTCGRFEIYAELADYESGVAQLKAFLANFRHGETGYDLESYLYTHLGRRAVEHLFRVCTGLDSMLIGEAGILDRSKTRTSPRRRHGPSAERCTVSSATQSRPGRPPARRRESAISRYP